MLVKPNSQEEEEKKEKKINKNFKKEGKKKKEKRSVDSVFCSTLWMTMASCLLCPFHHPLQPMVELEASRQLS